MIYDTNVKTEILAYYLKSFFSSVQALWLGGVCTLLVLREAYCLGFIYVLRAIFQLVFTWSQLIELLSSLEDKFLVVGTK